MSAAACAKGRWGGEAGELLEGRQARRPDLGLQSHGEFPTAAGGKGTTGDVHSQGRGSTPGSERPSPPWPGAGSPERGVPAPPSGHRPSPTGSRSRSLPVPFPHRLGTVPTAGPVARHAQARCEAAGGGGGAGLSLPLHPPPPTPPNSTPPPCRHPHGWVTEPACLLITGESAGWRRATAKSVGGGGITKNLKKKKKKESSQAGGAKGKGRNRSLAKVREPSLPGTSLPRCHHGSDQHLHLHPLLRERD